MKNSLQSISIVISAPSGTGKSTIINKLVEKDSKYELSISTTTRLPREGESDGVNYHFISTLEFENEIENDMFIEWAMVHGNYYGTSKKEIDRIAEEGHYPIFDIDVQGGRILRDKLPSSIFVFIVPPSLDVLESRLRNRLTDTEKQIEIRMHNSIHEIKEAIYYDYLIVNDNLDDAVEKLRMIVLTEMTKVKRNNDLIEKLLGEQNDNTIR